MNYSSINEAYNLTNYNEDKSNIYVIDLDYEINSDSNSNSENETDNNNNDNKINSIKLLNTYKKLNDCITINIELIENLENNKMLLFNFLSSICNKHTENINILQTDLIDDNNKLKECDELMMNYILKFNELYSKWNKEIYMKKKNKLEKRIEEDQIQLNGLRKIFINTTNEIMSEAKNNEKIIKNTCPICFENEINMVAIPCGHVCCNLCIFKNMKYNNGKCLCCRNPLKEYIKLFIQL